MRWADIEVPNRAVAVDAWARSACYPQSNFYPLSFRRPISYGRITNFHFRDCSGGSPRSKAGLCVCTSSPISIRTKPTFVNASVIVWEATAPVKLPTRHCLPRLIQVGRLGTSQHKGGISLTPFGSHLCWTCEAIYQYQVIVKLHGVFSSNCRYVASSRHLNFRRVHG